ncbi:MAG TPA: hypothetical protein VL949_00375 [Geobacteraceae bacterium]|nr:hypothetical protein [Geobacteraceae bacterium]
MLTSKRSLNLIICRFVSLFLCLSLATGCTTLNPLVPAEPQAIMAQVKPGDEVRLTTRDGRVRELTVQEATGQQLVGEQERVTLSDITMIERREFSTGKTVGLVCGIIGVVVLAFAISFLASFRP